MTGGLRDNPPIGELSFTATLEQRGPAAAVVLSDDQVAELGEGAKRFPVRATVAGHSWRGSVARMRGEFLLGLNREVREAAGVEAGDEVEVSLVLDTEERTVEIPPVLDAALADDAAAQDASDAVAYTLPEAAPRPTAGRGDRARTSSPRRNRTLRSPSALRRA